MSTSIRPAHADHSQFLADSRLLERELMGLRLHELIAVLANGDNESRHVRHVELATTALENVLRDYEIEVLERGLGVLPRSRLQMLLDQPALLLELQELLLGRGGAYWDQVTETLPDASRIQFSEAEWQERLGQTFVRGPKSKAKPRGDQARSSAKASKLSLTRQRGGRIAAVSITAALLSVAVGWYRSEMRLATARRQHADEVAALQSSFDAKLAAWQQEQASERVAAYCRLLHELSSLPATEQLVSLPADPLASDGSSLPPDEEVTSQREQLPSVEESLVSPTGREQAIARVVDALRRDAAAWVELNRDTRRYLEHPDAQVSHGAAMVSVGPSLEKTDN